MRQIGQCCASCHYWSRDAARESADGFVRSARCDLRDLPVQGIDWCVSHANAATAIVRWTESAAAETGIGEDHSGCAGVRFP